MKNSTSEKVMLVKGKVYCLIVVLLCLLWFQGCLEIKEDLIINQDGSGKLKVQCILGEKFTKMMELAASMKKAGGKTTTKGGLAFNKEELKSQFAGEGVEIESFSFEKREGKLHALYTINFSSIENLLKTKAFRNEQISFYQNKEGNLAFQMGTKSTQKEVLDIETMPKDLLEEFKADFSLSLPGKVLESNADSSEGNTLTWHYDKDKLKPEILTAVCEGKDLPFLANLPSEPKKIATVSYVYDPTGKPDPFRPFILEVKRPKEVAKKLLQPLQRYEISQLKLVGIIWQIDNPRAIFEDATGKGYIVSRGSYVGKHGGKVTAILKNEVIITEESKNILGETKIKEIRVKLHEEEGKSK